MSKPVTTLARVNKSGQVEPMTLAQWAKEFNETHRLIPSKTR